VSAEALLAHSQDAARAEANIQRDCNGDLSGDFQGGIGGVHERDRELIAYMAWRSPGVVGSPVHTYLVQVMQSCEMYVWLEAKWDRVPNHV
jgi:hypothetical protein